MSPCLRIMLRKDGGYGTKGGNLWDESTDRTRRNKRPITLGEILAAAQLVFPLCLRCPEHCPPLLGSSRNLRSRSGRQKTLLHALLFSVRRIAQSFCSRSYSAQLVL